MDTLFQVSAGRIEEVSLNFIRYAYSTIKWDGRMLGIVGPRGVGKTTLLLQYAKQQLEGQETLYIFNGLAIFCDTYYRRSCRPLL